MIIVHYEVYVLESRGWMLHARFPRQDRENAISEAKELETSLNVKVRVLRETYYTDTNGFEEAEVYITGRGLQEKNIPPGASKGPASAAAARPAAGPAKPSSAGKRPAAAPVRRSSTEMPAKTRQLLGRLFAIVAVALAVALVAIKFTPDIIKFMWAIGLRVSITPQGYSQMLFAIFVLTFLMVAVPLAARFLPSQTAIPTFRKPAFSFGGSGSAPPPPSERDKKLKKSLDKLADKALAEAPPEKVEEEEELPPLPADDTEVGLPEILPGLDEPEPDLPEIRPDPEEGKAKAKDAGLDEGTVQEAMDRGAKLEAVTQQGTANRFVNGAVAAVKTVVPQLDAYNKFALHLYLAGGIETLCSRQKLGGAAQRELMVTAMEGLGTKASLAKTFHDKLDEYMMDPRYMRMVQAGRSAMGDFISGDDDKAHRAIVAAIKDWNKPNAEKAPTIVTVMFTDMVGSTDLTQEVGDLAAQEIVRRHNSIVRTALSQFSGKEVKHTGDGIMASFPSAAGAVEAAQMIQRQVMNHNKRMPTQELHLRIGLNAGEPIQEEDDLFGATVQLAARICAATESDQILCSAVVRELAQGKTTVVFQHAGDRHLKGFKDKISLYEVGWK